VGGTYSMNGGGERSPDVLLKRSEKEITWKNCRIGQNSIYIFIEKRTAYISIYNLHLIPTLKKSFNIISSVNFLVKLR